MGYRSYGALWLSEAAMSRLESQTYEHNYLGIKTEVKLSNDLDNWGGRTETDCFGVKGWVYEFSYWKWYEGYPDVDAWTAFFNECEDEGIAFDFIRFGENEDDTETWSGLYFTVTRSWDAYPDECPSMMEHWTFGVEEE